MFLHLSVIVFTGGGACMAGGHAWQGVCMAGGMHGGEHAWQGACVAGACVAGVACMPCTPPGHYEIQLVNARAVRILLECILVGKGCTNLDKYYFYSEKVVVTSVVILTEITHHF